jgi:hypothetical protein
MSLITVLFNVLALVYVGRAVQLAVQVYRNRVALQQEPLTTAKQRLAEQAAFFLGVPPGVLIHEAAHALAILVFGGQVAEFGYRVFWGYVVPRGVFSPAQQWAIAVAGTVGSLVFGAVVWLALRRHASRTVQYFGLRAFRFQIYFSLLYYPLFSLFLPIGDWRIIYDFAATPLLSGSTAALHALGLLLFWRADRRGEFEMVAFDSAARQAQHEATMTSAAQGHPSAQLAAIAALRDGGAAREAGQMLDAFLLANPNSAEGHLQRAIQLVETQRRVGPDAVRAAGRALALGLVVADDVALAHIIAALYHLERGDGRAAEAELDTALTPTAAYDPARIMGARRAELHHLRGQAYRRQSRYEAALAEVEIALQLAEATAQPALIRRLNDERELIQKHAGRRLSTPE